MSHLKKATRDLLQHIYPESVQISDAREVEDEEYFNVFEETSLAIGLDLDHHKQLVSTLSKKTALKPSQFEFVNQISNGISSGKQILVFLTGGAGCGKSFTTEILIAEIEIVLKKKVVILASSGSAAAAINGQTVHKFLKLDFHLNSRLIPGTSEYVEVALSEVIIIDEVSMVSRELFDAVDLILSSVPLPSEVEALKKGKKTPKSFGGRSMILVGDLFQLPAISPTNSQIFHSHLWSSFICHVLKENCRQHGDLPFITLLNEVRLNQISPGSLHLIESRICGKGHPLTHECVKPTQSSLTICSLLKDVHRINQEELKKMEGELFQLKSLDSFSTNPFHGPPPTKFFPEVISLKIGAKVVITRNLDLKKQLTNGATGIVVKITNEYVIIERPNGRFPISKISQTLPFQGGSRIRKQFPLELAFAVTVHMVQGMTIDHSILFLDHSFFADGQGYVALSRVRTLQGLHIRVFDRNSIKVNTEISKFIFDGLPPPPPPPVTKSTPPSVLNPGFSAQTNSILPSPGISPTPMILPEVLKHPFVQMENSCHLDVFLESCFACLLFHPHTLLQEITSHQLLLKLGNINQQTPPSEYLIDALRFRLHNKRSTNQIKKKLRNEISETFGSGMGRGDLYSNPVMWCNAFSKNDLNGVIGLSFKKTSDCPHHSRSSIRVLPFLSVAFDGNLANSLDSYSSALNFPQGYCEQNLGYQSIDSSISTSIHCNLISEITIEDIVLPSILAIEYAGMHPVPLCDIQLLGRKYRFISATRRTGAHFIAYVFQEGRFWFFDGNSSAKFTPAPTFQNDHSLPGTREIIFYVSIDG